MSSDKFHSVLNEALHGLTGVHVVAEHILIVGNSKAPKAILKCGDNPKGSTKIRWGFDANMPVQTDVIKVRSLKWMANYLVRFFPNIPMML